MYVCMCVHMLHRFRFKPTADRGLRLDHTLIPSEWIIQVSENQQHGLETSVAGATHDPLLLALEDFMTTLTDC